MIFTDALPYIIKGVILVTLIDTLGSVASRKLDFNYTYLALLSLLTYSSMGYYASVSHGLKTALIASFVIGFYDAIVGVWLSQVLKANSGLNAEEEKNSFHPFMVLFLTGVAILFGFIGHLLV
jgi:hypothetical protein